MPLEPIQPMTHAIGGALGSAAALLAFYPLERARIELQSEVAMRPGANSRGSSGGARPIAGRALASLTGTNDRARADQTTLTECLHRLWRRQELYRGFSPIVRTLTISNFLFFYFHTFMKQLVASGRRTRASLLLASCLAGVVNVLLTNPLWVASLRIVTNETAEKSSRLWNEMRKIAREEGTGALWQGTWSSILLVSNPVIQFFTYEQLKTSILQRRRQRGPLEDTTLLPLEALVAGAASKTLATLLTYPLQLAQSVLRLQKSQSCSETATGTSRPKDRKKSYKTTWECLLRLYADGGVANLFTGMRAKLLQTALTAAFTFLTYEQILHAVHRAHKSLLLAQTTRGKR